MNSVKILFNLFSLLVLLALYSSCNGEENVKRGRLFYSDNNTFELKNIKNSPKQIIVKNAVTGIEKRLNLITDNIYKFETNEFVKSEESQLLYGDTPVLYSLEYLNQNFYYTGPLGVQLSKDVANFRIWSPQAQNIKLNIFKTDKTLAQSYDLIKKDKGLWEIEIPQTVAINGFYYRYEITQFGVTKSVIDPYAFTIYQGIDHQDSFGVIVDLNTVKFPKNLGSKKIIQSPGEYIGLEVSLRDFTVDPSSQVEANLRGTYKGLIQKLDHFKELGVNHIQIMPMLAFGSNNKLLRQFQDQDTLVSKINYNWGYDPQHYFSIDSWFSESPENPISKMNEFSIFVETAHKLGIGVVLDVVYNHVFKQDYLEDLAMGAYIRRGIDGQISYKSGAGASVESRSLMARRLIIDSMNFFKNYYKVDGFRFDLMGFIDQESMIEARKVLGPDTVLYGEGWEFTDLPDSQKTTKSHYPDVGLSMFNDTSRDSYAGEFMFPGFVQGNFSNNGKVRAGIIGSVVGYETDYNNDHIEDVNISHDPYHTFARSPLDTINYLAIHDGFTFWDKINLSTKGSLTYKKQLYKQALCLLFTSQGKIVLDGGMEMLRSKPLSKNDPERNRAHSSELALPEYDTNFFHENSYRSSDFTNRIDWNRLKEHSDIFDYLKKLVQIRKKIPELRMESAYKINQHLKFLDQFQRKKESEKNILFSDIEEFKIRFINGPKNGQLYITGEVHSGENKNPLNNPFIIKFEDGVGVIPFSKNEIINFDLKAWSDPLNLQIKLVERAGEWTSFGHSYSPMGNNTIKPSMIFNGVIDIDLNITDHSPGVGESFETGLITYQIKSLDNSNKFYVVVHNANNQVVSLPLPMNKLKAVKLYISGEEISVNGELDTKNLLLNKIGPHQSLLFEYSL